MTFKTRDQSAHDEIWKLECKIKGIRESMMIPIGECHHGIQPVEVYDAKTIKAKFDEIYEFLGVKPEFHAAKTKLVKTNQTGAK